MEQTQLKNVLEAILMAAEEPLSLAKILQIFSEQERPSTAIVRQALAELSKDYAEHAIELKELASGYCFQTKTEYSQWIIKLQSERPLRYSRALLETLAIIAYRQPVTRAEIEEIRGVNTSSTIMKTLLERDWVRMVGQREVPGRPGIYATTKQFLDDFNLPSLNDLPALDQQLTLPLIKYAESVSNEQASEPN